MKPLETDTQDAHAIFHTGMNALGQGHFKEAKAFLSQAAKIGHKEAKHYLTIFTKAGVFDTPSSP